MTAADKLAEAVKALEPFVDAFEAARQSYARRYGTNTSVGERNFDAMPDAWEMEHLKFTMGDYRRAYIAIAKLREADHG